MLVSGEEPMPDKSRPSELLDWKMRAQKAAGALFLAVEHEQRVHLGGIETDPIKIWSKLETVHLNKRPGTRFNAYDDLFSIRKQPEESLQSLMNRVDEAMRKIVNLRPKNFTLEKLDEELTCMSLIRSLPEEYNNFTSSLLLLDSLDKTKLQTAFVTEETNRSRRADPLSSNTSRALQTSAQGKSLRPRPDYSNYKCDYCGRTGHTSRRCYKRMDTLIKDSEASTSANTASSSAASSSEHFAGNASLHSDSSPCPTPRISAHADSLWCADTGATSHMTPHRHWFRNYKSLRVPVRLANNTIVYSAGMGSVVFVPEIDGQRKHSVEFTSVLHVPELSNNLLSVLYLTRIKSFTVVILENVINFIRHGSILFSATVNASNCAYLEGSTISVPSPVTNSALISSTLPTDTSLWHRRLCHHHYSGIDRILKQQLVEAGMQMD